MSKKLMLLAGMSAALGIGSLLGTSKYSNCLDLSRCPVSAKSKTIPTKRPKSKQQKQSRKQNKKK